MSDGNQIKLIGNQQVEFYLSKILKQAKEKVITGTYIFVGRDSGQKHKAMNWLINSLICEANETLPCGKCRPCHLFANGLYHDFFEIKLEQGKQNISIEQVKDLLARIGLKSFMNNYRFVLIDDAETLSDGAANALLKTLEEPGNGIIIFLLTDNLDKIPATIISRSNIINIRRASSNLIKDYLIASGLDVEKATIISKLSAGQPSLSDLYRKNENLFNFKLGLATDFIQQLNSDIHSRLEYSKNILNFKKSDSDIDAIELIIIWQSVIRDLLLLSYKHRDLITYELLFDDLIVLTTKYHPKKLIQILEQISQTIKYLKANVNKQLALENVLINI